MKKTIPLFLFLLLAGSGFAQEGLKYQKPPKEIMDLVSTKPVPAVSVDDKAKFLLLMYRSEFPTIAELAQQEYRIAGLRLNPANFGPSRATGFSDIQIKNIATGKVSSIQGLPAELRASSLQWSPNQDKFAFVHSTESTHDLYVVTIADGRAIKVNKTPLNLVLGGSFQWVDNDAIIYKAIVPEKELTVKSGAPAGPIVQESMGRSAASRTYQDLIQNPYDEALFEHYATAQLVVNRGGTETKLGKPDIYRSFSVSPDDRFIMITTIQKPFSYLVPASGFPHQVSILDMQGKLVKTLATNKSTEGQPIGFDDVSDFPRGFNWRSDAPATVVYVQALDKGMGKSKSEYRDALYTVNLDDNSAPRELLRTKRRFGGIVWGNAETAIVYEQMFADRRLRMNRFNPTTGKMDSLFERSSNDAYSDIGSPLTKRNQYDRNTLILLNGKELLLSSSGSSPEGDMPLVQTFDITTGAKKLWWRSAAPYYETIVDVIDPQAGTFLTSRESITEPANYYIRNVKKKIAPIAVTNFENPYKSLATVKKQKITYPRADGISLTGDLYLPPNYDSTKDGPLPVIIWAYPREYKSAADAAQVRGSKYTFTRINYGSPIFWVMRGYAVLDNAEMPIVGEGSNEPNDNFIPQLHLNAHAAIQKLAKMGVGDSNRVAVGGHSYGAFMTANLLAHTKLFKAGIARSGAYNRTLTPFGFQAEERTYWQAPEVYHQMSPFNYANQIKTPILLIHGEMDNNSGTFPIQSERLYNAIKGHGGTVRYVVLPYESHGYAARENILHMLWEQDQWLERFVKSNKTKGGEANRAF